MAAAEGDPDRRNTAAGPLLPARPALFLDFDGTLVEIAPDPGSVRVPPALPGVLARIADRLSGAVAIVSGRPLGEIDRFLDPFASAASGLHGLERRLAAGEPVVSVPRPEPLDRLVAAFAASGFGGDGVLVEDKGATVAFHFRAAPERGAAISAFVRERARELSGLAVVEGKMVIEVKPRGADKGLAIRAHLATAAFRGRIPVFLGDDVTDEDGFAAVLELGGVAVKVGDGPTVATHRLADVAAVHSWLTGLAQDGRRPNDESDRDHDGDHGRGGR